MKPGAELTLDITDIAYGGAGLARHEGRVVFVPFTIPGEKVRARITRVRRGWAQAAVTRIEEPSTDRLVPPCPYFTRCGGCAYQHIAYPRQLDIKTRQVAEALRRIGKFAAPPVEPARPSPQDYGYRNRITMHVEPPSIGFRGTEPRELVDVRACLLADEAVNAALTRLRAKKYLRSGPATLRSDPAGRGFRQVNDGAAEVLANLVADLAGAGHQVLTTDVGPDPGLPGYVQADLCDRAEMAVESLGRGLVVIRGDDEGAVGTGSFGVLREGDGFLGRVGARAADNFDATGGDFDRSLDHIAMFLVRKRG